jgi:hypothetical protein
MDISGGVATWKHEECNFGGIVNLAMYLNYHTGCGYDFFEVNPVSVWEHLNCPDDWIDSWNKLLKSNKEHFILMAEEKLIERL